MSDLQKYAWAKGETRDKARQEIMFYILSFCVTRVYPNIRPSNVGSLNGFVPDMKENRAQVGDLVILGATRAWSKWQIGWLRKINQNDGWPTYTIESLEDGELADWSNVSIGFLEREELNSHPSWRWNDRQHAFYSRWKKVCYNEKDAYIVLPMPPVFGEGYSITLGTRTRFGLDDIKPSYNFPDWRKVTKVMMGDCYDQCVAERKALAKAED